MPISNSSHSHFWQILVGVFSGCWKPEVFVVGVYHGYKKPSNFGEFLMPFINEVKGVLHSFKWGSKSITVNIRSIVCDAPARNSCLGTKSYWGKFCCGRCCQKGVYTDTHGMTFPEISAEKPTDKSFRNKLQPKHHNFESPFLHLDIDMISQFPLDCLHTVYLAVTKRLLSIWMNGTIAI